MANAPESIPRVAKVRKNWMLVAMMTAEEVTRSQGGEWQSCFWSRSVTKEERPKTMMRRRVAAKLQCVK